jgi:hypothetical protein
MINLNSETKRLRNIVKLKGVWAKGTTNYEYIYQNNKNAKTNELKDWYKAV